ncbi:hypothetical protein GA0070613_4418 [Micromonospora inositola]|uniref:Uncharacterized protein n=1 Tax=Micromonospora inositola TaxID=47865 RepID=A0A1C5JCC9_9ACTN|nr:hypothetical protein GA0070613_4418 [Micromonospora inositola]
MSADGRASRRCPYVPPAAPASGAIGSGGLKVRVVVRLPDRAGVGHAGSGTGRPADSERRIHDR